MKYEYSNNIFQKIFFLINSFKIIFLKAPYGAVLKMQIINSFKKLYLKNYI